MVIRVDHPVIPLIRDLKVCMDYFLDHNREKVVVLILVGILILTVPFHLFEVLDNLVQILSSDLIEVSDFAYLSPRADGKMLVVLVQSLRGLSRLPFLARVHQWDS